MEALIPLFLFVVCSSAQKTENPSGSAPSCSDPIYMTTKATAVLAGDVGSEDIFGMIYFEEKDGLGSVTVIGTVHNLTKGEHGFHIHELGNIRNGCDDAGSHFNPDGYDHAGIKDPQRHAGDMGNIVANEQGIARVNIRDNAFTLNGDYSVIGRALVVHQDPDDGGRGNEDNSKTTGHSGKRVACGVIGISTQKLVASKN